MRRGLPGGRARGAVVSLGVATTIAVALTLAPQAGHERGSDLAAAGVPAEPDVQWRDVPRSPDQVGGRAVRSPAPSAGASPRRPAGAAGPTGPAVAPSAPRPPAAPPARDVERPRAPVTRDSGATGRRARTTTPAPRRTTPRSTPRSTARAAARPATSAKPVVRAQAPSAGTDVARGRRVFASSSERSALSPSRAVDGDGTTRWASVSGVDQGWIAVDLGRRYDIGRVRLAWEAAYARKYRIQVSDDGQWWRTVFTNESGNGGSDTVVFSGLSGRYVKMDAWERGSEWGYSLWSFEVHAR